MKKQKMIEKNGEVRELSADDFKHMRPVSDVLPNLVKEIRKAKGRPKTKNPKLSTTIRIEPGILEFFKKPGRGWQTRINDALKEYVSSHQK